MQWLVWSAVTRTNGATVKAQPARATGRIATSGRQLEERERGVREGRHAGGRERRVKGLDVAPSAHPRQFTSASHPPCPSHVDNPRAARRAIELLRPGRPRAGAAGLFSANRSPLPLEIEDLDPPAHHRVLRLAVQRQLLPAIAARPVSACRRGVSWPLVGLRPHRNRRAA